MTEVKSPRVSTTSTTPCPKSPSVSPVPFGRARDTIIVQWLPALTEAQSLKLKGGMAITQSLASPVCRVAVAVPPITLMEPGPVF